MRNFKYALQFGALLSSITLLAACGGGSDETAKHPSRSTTTVTTTVDTPTSEERQAEDETTQAEPEQADSTVQPGTATDSCGDIDAAQAVNVVLENLTPWREERQWRVADDAVGYDACASLSYIVFGIERATASSPYHIALYHHGEYLGTATQEPRGFWPTVRQKNDKEVEVEYRYLRQGESTAEASGRSYALFTWDDGSNRVVMTGTAPDLPES